MKKPLLLFYFTCCIFHFSFSQNPLVKQWDKRFGGTNYDWLQSLIQTKDKGYLLSGWSESPMSGDKTEPSWGHEDYWLIKIDSLGNKQWDKRYGAANNDDLFYTSQTFDGGYIIGGESNSGLNGDKTEPSWGGYDYWIVKIDSQGVKQWDKRFGGYSDEYFGSIQQTSDNGYIVGGYSLSDSSGDKTQYSRGSWDYWIVKIDSLGNKQWDKRFGGGNWDELHSVKETLDGGYILGGSSYSGISGDKTQSNWDPSHLTADYWIVKIDSVGNFQWDKTYGGPHDDEFQSLQQTNDNGYILGGWSSSQIGGDKTQFSWGLRDYWIVKVDSLGNKQWDKDFGGTDNESKFGYVVQTYNNGYLLSGTSFSNIGGDKTENNLGYEQTWIVKTDSVGNKTWDKTIFTAMYYDDKGLAIQTNDGCYAFANYTEAGIGGYKTQPCWGDYDYWIIKFCDTTLTTSITQLPDYPNSFSISPSPADKELRIKNAELRIKEIEIYDLFGRRVLHSTFNIQHSTFTIDISTLTPGIYFLRAGNEVRKFVKE